MGPQSDDPHPASSDTDPALERSTLSPLMPRSQPPFVGAGLVNLGNTCFMNAVLQCLTHMVPLLEKLIMCRHTSPCHEDKVGFCMICVLRSHIEESIKYSGGFFEPNKFVDNLTKIAPHFYPGQQEDAHELLHCLLDRLDTRCDGPSSREQPSSLQNSLVDQTFRGRLRSQLRCCQCGHCSDSFERLLDISLEIDDVDSLIDALCSFTKVEKVEDAICGGCKAQGTMEKELKLDQAPEVVAIHLKRFESTGLFDKNDKAIKYPLELDLKAYLSSADDSNQSNYDLYAIVVHSGSAFYGHYTSIVRSSPMAWYLMDDSQVTRVSEDCVLEQNAYILFYVKRGLSPWFSSFVRTQLMPCSKDMYPDDSPVSVLDRMDMRLVSYSSSSSGETPEKDRNPSACEDASSESRVVMADIDNQVSPCQAYDGAEKTRRLHKPDNIAPKFSEAYTYHGASPCQADAVDKRTTPIQYASDNIINTSQVAPSNHSASPFEPDDVAEKSTPLHKTYRVLDIFEDEPLEDEMDDHLLLPQVSVGQKRRREPVKPAPLNIKDPRLTQFGRLLKTMPSSRRARLLACIPQEATPKVPQSQRSGYSGYKQPRLY